MGPLNPGFWNLLQASKLGCIEGEIMTDVGLFYFGIAAFSLMACGIFLTVREFKSMNSDHESFEEPSEGRTYGSNDEFRYAPGNPPAN